MVEERERASARSLVMISGYVVFGGLTAFGAVRLAVQVATIFRAAP